MPSYNVRRTGGSALYKVVHQTGRNVTASCALPSAMVGRQQKNDRR